MRLVHDSGDGSEVLATTVETADSPWRQARGLTFRRSLPDDYAMAFRFATARTRGIHTLFVLVPIDVVWVVDGRVRRVERLRPWRGLARARADLIVELPAGAADGVEPGDGVALEDG